MLGGKETHFGLTMMLGKCAMKTETRRLVIPFRSLRLNTSPARRALFALVLAAQVTASLNCSSPDGGTGNDNDNGGSDVTGTSTDVPAGFPTAARVVFDQVDRLIIDGDLEKASDVMVYDLGALSLGDRIDALCIAKSGSALDPMVALFDADGYRIFWNDDINPATSNFDAAFDGFIRHDSDNYFLAVTSTSFFATSGQFRCTLQLEPDVAVAPIIGQTVVLQLAGGLDVAVAGVDYGNLPQFDAANIDASFAGDTSEFEGLILDIIRDDYAQFDISILTTADDEPTINFTTVFFGTSSTQQIFGIADDIDFYNGDDMDSAIVFLEAFGSLGASVEATAQALANVVSHEIGHTLGLMHTTDVTTLMDTTGQDTTLLVDQSLGTADVFDFPIGKQNAPLLLAETVGSAAKTRDDASGQWRCGTCGATLSLVTGTKAATAE